MMRFKPAIAALCTTFALAAAAQAPNTVQVPRTAAARAAGDLIARAERAITGYVAACASRDVKCLNAVTTDDVRIEFVLDEPGMYLALDSDSLMASCMPGVSPPRDARVWIFPTNDTDAVFVQYDASAPSSEATSQPQLVLVEMRGDQIARMRNFAAVPTAMVSSATRVAAATPCTAHAIK